MSRRPPLLAAVKRDDVAGVRALLATPNVDPNARSTPRGKTPLIAAVMRDNYETCRDLLCAGANVEAPYRDGMRALHIAALRDRSAIMRLLIKHGASTAARAENGVTALHIAVVAGSTDALAALLDAGVDVRTADARTADETPILHAALRRCKKANGGAALGVVAMLVRAGAPLDSRDSSDYTPAHIAAGVGSVAAIDILARAGAPLTLKQHEHLTPLMLAAARGKAGAVRALARLAPESINEHMVKEHDTGTALHAAVLLGEVDTVAELLACPGIDVDAPSAGGTALAKTSNPTIRAMLLSAGAAPCRGPEPPTTRADDTRTDAQLAFLLSMMQTRLAEDR